MCQCASIRTECCLHAKAQKWTEKGDTRSKKVAIAADATAGKCQNCSVLHQSLAEYVASLLALKQKIKASDDSIRLQQQLEELQIRFVALQNKTADYESLQAELEEKKDALKAYGQMTEDFDNLKRENSKITAEKEKLEDQLNNINDLKETLLLENVQLKREKGMIENDLLKTQASLKKSQVQADQVATLTAENTKIINVKKNLDSKVKMLEDSVVKQKDDIVQLSIEKTLLERNIDDLKVRLIQLERERNKEYRSASTQVSTPEAPKVDKEKFRTLLENLWACVEPQQLHPKNHHPEHISKHTPPSSPQKSPRSRLSKPSPPASQRIRKPSLAGGLASILLGSNGNSPKLNSVDETTANRPQTHQQPRASKKETDSPKKSNRSSEEHKPEEASADLFSSEVLFEEIRTLFKPMAPCISPISDLEPDMEPMETDEEDIEHRPKSAVGETSYIPSPSESSHCTKSEPTPEENVNLPVDTSQDMKDASSGNGSMDLEQNELSDVVETKRRSSTGVEEIGGEKNLQPDPELEAEHAASPSHAVSEVTDLVRAVPSPLDNNDSQDKVDDQSESQPKMEVDLGPCNGKIAETGTAEVIEPPRKTPVTSEQAEEVQQGSPSPNAATCTEASADTGMSFESKSPQQPGGFELDSEVAADPQKMNRCLSQDADEAEGDSSENAEEQLESTLCATPSKDQGNTEVEQREVTNACSPLRSHKADSKSSEFRKEEAECSETAQEDTKTPLKEDEVTEKSSDLNSQQQEAVVRKSLVDKMHSYCQQLSPTFLFPNVQLLQTNPTPKKLNFSDDVELIRPHTAPTVGEVEDEVEKEEEGGGAKDSDCKQPIKLRGRKCNLASPAASSKAAKRGLRKSAASPVTQSPGANGEEEESQPTEDSAKATPEVIGQVCLEMGPPLPRLLTPLRTPPKADRSIHPRHAIGRLSFPSPLDGLASPATPTKGQVAPGGQHPASFSSSSLLNSPVHPNGVPSSPLQFGSATPKHAVPVPGRLPSAAAVSSSPSSSTASHSSSSSSSPSQDNSVRMLDSMYPELSAHARTLSILRGNISSPSSASTAFTKAETRGEKRPPAALAEPRMGKCPKLDDGAANGREGAPPPQPVKPSQPTAHSGFPLADAAESGGEEWIAAALKRVEEQCFDLLPVIQSHLYVGNLTKKPVMRDEEKEVVAEVSQDSSKADGMLSAILSKLKAERRDLSCNYTQALCRVYTGICRQRGDWQKARVLAYSILTEDFQDCAKLILFMVTTWHNFLSHKSSLCQAILAVTKVKAQEALLSCLSAFLGWDKTPPCDVDDLISTTLAHLRSGSAQPFAKHSRYGFEPGAESWEHIFTLHLLCAHKKWKWTYDNVLGKELWPLMNTWVAQPRDQQAPISNVTVATVLRLIGLLSQLGIAEKCVSSVLTVASVINTFGRHGPTEGVPWEVQLAAVYCIYDLSPCDPKQALNALAEWRGETSQIVPPAVSSCINQLASICRAVRS